MSWLIFSFWLGLTLPLGQDPLPGAEKSETSEPSPNLLTQLANCRAGLLDREAHDDDRKRWAELLFTIDAPQAKSLILALLNDGGNVPAQRTLCDVIAERASAGSMHVDNAFVDPLMGLFDAEADDLRAAAARALAAIDTTEVLSRLGDVAAASGSPMPKRLAAIDALGTKVDRREAVGALIGLLDTGDREIMGRVTAALQPAAGGKLGSEPERLRAWWAEKSRLTAEAWLEDRLQLQGTRLRVMEQEWFAAREEFKRRGELLSGRLNEFQRDVYRSLGAEQREVRLAAWLEDALPEVKLNALTIIQASIADEGRRPSGEQLTALLRLLRDGSSAIRRQTLLIVQTLNDPLVEKALLAQLETEKDVPTRQAILKALGKLESTESIPVLLREITSPEGEAGCVREAAIALGQVAAKLEEGPLKSDVIAGLKERYRRASNDAESARAALLSAMAGVADPDFTAEFVDALESTDASFLRAALHGLRMVGDRSRLPRIRTLTGDIDDLVRLDATEAVAKLGSEDADLECLLTRLNPTVEANDPIREAAWQGFRDFLGRKTLEERLFHVQRLRDMPDLEIRYLVEQVAVPTLANDQPETQAVMYDRLATLLTSQGRCADAVPWLRKWFETASKRSEAQVREIGLRWLEAALRANADGEIPEIIQQLCAAAAGPTRKEIVDVVQSRLESPEMVGNADRAQALLAALQAVPPDSLGERWSHLLEDAAARLSAASSPPPKAPIP